jgi:hypothetical protein
MAIPDKPDTLLRRADAARALTEAGFPTATSTLSTLASRGGGPPHRRFGRVPLYQWSDLLAWAHGRLGPKIRSTSEAETRSIPAKSQRQRFKLGEATP